MSTALIRYAAAFSAEVMDHLSTASYVVVAIGDNPIDDPESTILAASQIGVAIMQDKKIIAALAAGVVCPPNLQKIASGILFNFDPTNPSSVAELHEIILSLDEMEAKPPTPTPFRRKGN